MSTVEEGLRNRAQQWMDEHPIAMGLFESMAQQAMARGRKFGIALLTERIRWEYRIERSEEEEEHFKISNNHRAYIARELIRRHPALAGFIETKITVDEGRGDSEVEQ